MKKLLILALSLFMLTLFASCEEQIERNPVIGVEIDGIVYSSLEGGTELYVSGVTVEKEEYTVLPDVNGIPVTVIGYSAFGENGTVKKINLPDSVKEFRPYAFYNCKLLTDINFPASLETIEVFAFADCHSLKTVKLPQQLKAIKRYAFMGCTALDELHINASLETIQKDAFYNCGRITALHLENVAAWCGVSIEDHETNPIAISDTIYINGELTEELKIEGVEIINDFAFYKMSGIKTLIIGDGVTSIGKSAFSNCKSIEKVYLSDTVERIDTSAFNSCEKLYYLSVGKRANYFGGLAFYGCSSLQILNISDMKAWCSAFFYTDNSGSANPMRYAEKIFVGGVEQTNDLIIPEGVTSITTLSFISFPGERITLPASLKTIEKTAFYQTNIKDVYYMGTAASWKTLIDEIGANNFSNDTNFFLRTS